MKTLKSIALLSLFVLALPGCFGGYFNMSMSPELKEHGVTAPATIADIWDTGWTVNDNPVIGMHVDVHPADGPSFRATIERCAVSRIAIPQYQPGKEIDVRYDPQNPAVVMVDVGTGNPYHDQFTSTPIEGAQLQPPPPSPTLYRGTSELDADYLALMENGYVPLGLAAFDRGGENPQLALAQGKEIHAAVVVVYGQRFDAAAGALADLPFRAGAPAADTHDETRKVLSKLPKLPPSGRMATYWGQSRHWVFGLFGRELNADEQTRLKRSDGVVAAIVPLGSPAAAAHIETGDVIVAFNGKPIHHSADLSQSYIESLAGRKITVDLLRDGTPMSVSVQLGTP
jgi:PDZ domain